MRPVSILHLRDTYEIGGPGSPNNQLQDGAVFAMITDQGNYAQAQVITAGADMTIEFITYRLD